MSDNQTITQTTAAKKGGFIQRPSVDDVQAGGGCCGQPNINVKLVSNNVASPQSAAVGGCCGEPVSSEAGATGCCGTPAEKQGCCG